MGILINCWRASETLTGLNNENRRYMLLASETLSGVTQSKFRYQLNILLEVNCCVCVFHLRNYFIGLVLGRVFYLVSVQYVA